MSAMASFSKCNGFPLCSLQSAIIVPFRFLYAAGNALNKIEGYANMLPLTQWHGIAKRREHSQDWQANTRKESNKDWIYLLTTHQWMAYKSKSLNQDWSRISKANVGADSGFVLSLSLFLFYIYCIYSSVRSKTSPADRRNGTKWYENIEHIHFVICSCWYEHT